MRILAAIATAGRQELLGETVGEFAHQSRLPDQVIICSPLGEYVDQERFETLPFAVEAICGSRGAAAQRNAILDRAADFDVIVFFDDDFFPERTYLANVETLFQRHKDVVVATGNLIEDGIHGPGLTPDYARRRLADASVAPVEECAMIRYYGAYGCNMAIRLAPVREHGLVFDEALPLYSWQEDIDFSRQMAPYGRIVRSDALTGVHLGVKRGRTSGVKFGYSQVANPIYLVRKRTMSISFAAETMLKNVLANAVRVFHPEPHVDRAGRCKGNLLALKDLLMGRLDPRRILELESSQAAEVDNRARGADGTS